MTRGPSPVTLGGVCSVACPHTLAGLPALWQAFQLLFSPLSTGSVLEICFLIILFGSYPQFKMCFPGQRTLPAVLPCSRWCVLGAGPEPVVYCIPGPLFHPLFFSPYLFFPRAFFLYCIIQLLLFFVQCVFNRNVIQKLFSCTSAFWFTIVLTTWRPLCTMVMLCRALHILCHTEAIMALCSDAPEYPLLCAACPGLLSAGVRSPSPTMPPTKFVTWNVRRIHARPKCTAILSHLKAMQAEVYVLLETSLPTYNSLSRNPV